MSINSTEHRGPSIVTHIRDLLPLHKHAVFHVKLVIHQLQSVPLMSGEFRIKWKFRHLQAVNSAGQPIGFGRALALKFDGQKKRRVEHATVRDNWKGKGKEVAHEDTEEDHVQEQDMSALSLPILPCGRPHSSHSNLPRSKLSTSSSTSTSTSNFHDTPSLNTPPLEDPGIDYRIHARGHTLFLPLCDFRINFESEVNVAVQMAIEKDSLALLSSELKLTVMQRVIPNDPEAPLNPRLGHVNVNLAEYVDAGPVTRNYLLRRSKVNAMLNMTITLTQISGEETYRAPPLRKEEIKAGISDFLSASNVPLPSLGPYMPVDDPWLSSSLGEFIQLDEDGMLISQVDEPEEPADPSSELPEQQQQPKKRWRVVGSKRGSQSKNLDSANPLPPKTSDASPQKEQLHPTEALIETIFNPYPSMSDTASPFTCVPPAPPPKPPKPDSGTSEGNGTDGTSRGSFDSSQRASATPSDQGHEGGITGGSGSSQKWWRRKTGSRPVTPRLDSASSYG
ncbi:hypothetical protein JB92DRAFT_2912197 [Gautieria morchelliformis]|nr:hypothetical protein JB92DRAFT_2912197 [Gautieria morchelliformis]